ncbi:MAG: SpoIIE family protein phosphatase [Deltaproteobacteria bacterium]|nr:SpoIIE family protein phosphatase [Deltaproteobacteria bacterium]
MQQSPRNTETPKKMTIRRILDRIADVDTSYKVLACFFILSILPACLNLYVLDRFPIHKIMPFAGLYLVLMIVIQFPACNLISHLLVLRNLSKVNAYCRQVKKGMYHASFDLPPKNGDENDFLRAKCNLYWMGQIIASREQKLITAHDALRISQAKVMESIEYASRIQQTLLPSESVLKAAFRDHFVWWEPRDVVGGDTYCVAEDRNGYFVAAIDCTGHGVPGAFMTLIVHALLEQCLRSEISDDPALVLSQMNRRLNAFLHRGDAADPVDDGFDAAVCHIGRRYDRMVFAGAGLPLYYESDGEILEIKGDRAGVGDSRFPENTRYTNHIIDLADISKIYLSTDGVIDQIGGPNRLPFGKKRFKRILGRVHALSFAEQKKALLTAWRGYAGDENKRDDLTVFGFFLPPFSGE